MLTDGQTNRAITIGHDQLVKETLYKGGHQQKLQKLLFSVI